MNFMLLWIGGGIVALILVVLATIFVCELVGKRRGNALAGAGELLGLSFAAREARWPEISQAEIAMCRRGGSNKAIRNVLKGRIEEREALVFDFRYVLAANCRIGVFSSPPDPRGVYDQTVVLLRLPGASLPRFELRTGDALHGKTNRSQGWHRVATPEELDLAPDYLCRGEREEEISSLLRAGLAATVLERENLCVDAGGEWVAVYRHDVLVEPEGLRDLVADAAAVAGVLRYAASRLPSS